MNTNTDTTQYKHLVRLEFRVRSATVTGWSIRTTTFSILKEKASNNLKVCPEQPRRWFSREKYGLSISGQWTVSYFSFTLYVSVCTVVLLGGWFPWRGAHQGSRKIPVFWGWSGIL
jgi:hypothetical protein